MSEQSPTSRHRRGDANGACADGRRLCGRDQHGMSITALLAVIGVTVFLGLFALRVGPAYLENLTIEKIVEDKTADESLMRAPRSKIYASLNKAYRTNNLWDLKAEDTIRLKRDAAHGHVMDIAYERRANLFANIDVVTVFGEPETAQP